MTIHQRSTRASAAASTGGRACVQAMDDAITSTPAADSVLFFSALLRRGRGFPPERAEYVVGRPVGLVRQRLREPLLVVGLDALDVGDDRRLGGRVLHFLDLHPELVVLRQLRLVVLRHAPAGLVAASRRL